jgi:molecular chaperone HtpG
MERRFQINLNGIIDLLSNHLYSTPSVYVRELLQNATDAIRAREQLDPSHEGRIEIHISGGDSPQIIFTDNGIGLTEDETHQFLATIGESSKRDDVLANRGDFIGQFGIGLLSCFVVSDEIAMVTRSAKGGPAVSWRGSSDGRYETTARDSDDPVGTTVHLRAKDTMGEWLDPERVRELVWHFGALLPYPITLTTEHGTEHVNSDPAPWLAELTGSDKRATYMAFGERMFGRQFIDYIEIRCEAGDVRGIAYVLPTSPGPRARSHHRVYLRNMLLSEEAENVLPEWAFFVTCVLNTNELRPTASRESFYEDETLIATREALGAALRAYLIELRRSEPRRLELIIDLHYRAIKALAAHDDEFLAMFLDYLPFETTFGRMPWSEIRKKFETMSYARSVDEFRQIAQIAAAQNMCVINGGYTWDIDILRRAAQLMPDVSIAPVAAPDLVDQLTDLDLSERRGIYDFVRVGDLVLQPMKCEADIKKFKPVDLPVIYISDPDADFLRTIERTKDVSDDHWGGILDGVAKSARTSGYAQLVFNYENPLIRRLAGLDDSRPIELSIQMLYIQALLLGHHPLSSREMALMNTGLLELIEWGIDVSTKTTLN